MRSISPAPLVEQSGVSSMDPLMLQMPCPSENKMSRSRFMFRLLAATYLGLIALACASFAQQQPSAEYEPRVGQRGKDVVWVPTPQALVDQMLKMAKVTPQDYVVDLGSGDGRTVITAAKI